MYSRACLLIAIISMVKATRIVTASSQNIFILHIYSYLTFKFRLCLFCQQICVFAAYYSARRTFATRLFVFLKQWQVLKIYPSRRIADYKFKAFPTHSFKNKLVNQSTNNTTPKKMIKVNLLFLFVIMMALMSLTSAAYMRNMANMQDYGGCGYGGCGYGGCGYGGYGGCC